jgi:hypothetical protein
LEQRRLQACDSAEQARTIVTANVDILPICLLEGVS